MAKFKVGDKVKVLLACSGIRAGEICEVGLNNGTLTLKDSDGDWACTCEHRWELVEKAEEIKINKKTIMTKAKTLFTRLVDKDVKTLYEAGFLNGDLELTEEGKKELLNIVFLANKAELVKVAEEKLKEEKDK